MPKLFCFTVDLCLSGAILNFKAFCFGAIPCRHNDRVDRLWECATFRAQLSKGPHNLTNTGPHLS
jgi:hypothetical protein